VLLVLATGCANNIKDADAVIWDRVEGTDKVSLDEERVDGAVARAKVRFICQKRQFAVTNDYVTPYVGAYEVYEVPIGIPGTVVGIVWYVVSELATLGAIDNGASTSALNWGVAGLNPFLNCENGMFAWFVGERYEIREKKGSRRPQEGSSPEPYDAMVPPDGGKVKAWFDGGDPVDITVGEDVLLTLNLVELAQAMPNTDSQKIMIEVALKWSMERPAVPKTVAIFIDKPLADKLYALKGASKTLMTTTDPAAFKAALKEVEDAGFTREAAMIRDKRKGELAKP